MNARQSAAAKPSVVADTSESPALANLFLEQGHATRIELSIPPRADIVFMVISGCVKVTAPTSNGTAIVELCYQGDFVGIDTAMAGKRRITTSARAYRHPPGVYTLTTNEFKYHLGQSREALWEVGVLLAARSYMQTDWRLENHGPVASRLARCLLRIASPASGEIPVTQAELAATIGASQVSAENELRKLRARGIVATGYGTIVICDRGALRIMAKPAGP